MLLARWKLMLFSKNKKYSVSLLLPLLSLFLGLYAWLVPFVYYKRLSYFYYLYLG